MKAKFFDNWTNQLRKGVLELCILNDIRNGRMYGYEVARKLRKIEGPAINKGTIYPILKRLKSQGLVKTFIRESPEGPPRKYYELTQQGKDMVYQMNAYWQTISNQTNSIKKRKRS